jgi:hypothetical protein
MTNTSSAIRSALSVVVVTIVLLAMTPVVIDQVQAIITTSWNFGFRWRDPYTQFGSFPMDSWNTNGCVGSNVHDRQKKKVRLRTIGLNQKT